MSHFIFPHTRHFFMVYRRSGDWMVLWDDRILEILNEDGYKSCGMIEKYDGIYVGSAHISNRLKKLAEHNLVEPLGRGMYDITSEGELYLKGYYDVQNEEKINYEADSDLSEVVEQHNEDDFIPD